MLPKRFISEYVTAQFKGSVGPTHVVCINPALSQMCDAESSVSPATLAGPQVKSVLCQSSLASVGQFLSGGRVAPQAE